MTDAPHSPATLQRMANAIRALSMDAVEAAKSGHPGMPMGAADVATVLFSRFLKFDPKNPDWPDRDRFVLSAGHGSMLLYSLAYLTGYDGVGIDDLKSFRQLGSRTAGHPEYGHMPGVETTTGPLGQGLANAVGMAIAEAHLNARFGDDLVDHYTYALAGDGCLMEGISQEAISLAGHLKLRKLIVLFDDNEISIDGPVSLSDSTNQLERFAASGWSVERIDGHDYGAIAEAIERARSADAPSLIACRTVIGFGAPSKSGKASSHGAPLGEDEIKGARKQLDWPHAPFEIPDDILDDWRQVSKVGAAQFETWSKRHSAASNADAFDAAIASRHEEKLRPVIKALKQRLIDDPQKVATRKASEIALSDINAAIDETVGGSADLTGSNNTRTKSLEPLTSENYAGRYIYYGIREHAMAAAMNGMALHKGVTPYGGTFLVFSDYCRPSIRLAALMGIRVVFVMTHDSIGLGEDGPTHQPVEHLAALRAMPGLTVFRPCDAVETAECWELALRDDAGPSLIALTRQSLPQMRLAENDENLCTRGGYVLAEAENPAVTLIATGSEVSIAKEAADRLAADSIAARIVSMPSFELFAQQSADYRERVLGAAPRIGIEAAVRQGWDAILRPTDEFIGMSGFGASAPGAALFEHFGITSAAIIDAAKKLTK